MPQEEKEEREALIAEGMGSWLKTDFRKFCAACERHGRKAKAAVCADVALSTKKSEAEVKKYFDLFWSRYKELAGWDKILDKIERGEKRIERRLAIERVVKDKVKQYSDPMTQLQLDYGSNKGKAFTVEEDRFLICKMAELGYGAWDLLQLEIRSAWQFRFDWFLKSRSTADLSRRCDSLMRIIEREQGKTTKRKSSSSDGGATKKKH
jgi:SWI/SNF-related matrix-associated actin-dependent regulator of chromatin subfamily A member 5